MTIDVSAYTNKGGREINEDSMLHNDKLFIVADGLGGHSAGEEASRTAVDFISQNLGTDYSETKLKDLIEKANTAVYDLGSDALTTVAMAIIDKGVLHYANVGDSRVYVLRKNRIFAYTKDHSVCQTAVDMGELKYEDIRGNEDRSKLLKVLGNPAPVKLKKLYQPIRLQDGDAFIVCSDGFWENIYEHEMEHDLDYSENAEQWLRAMIKRLLDKTNGKGDNYTVICGIYHDKNAVPLPALPIPALSNINIKFVAAGAIALIILIIAIIIGSGGSGSTDSKASDVTETTTAITTTEEETDTVETEETTTAETSAPVSESEEETTVTCSVTTVTTTQTTTQTTITSSKPAVVTTRTAATTAPPKTTTVKTKKTTKPKTEKPKTTTKTTKTTKTTTETTFYDEGFATKPQDNSDNDGIATLPNPDFFPGENGGGIIN